VRASSHPRSADSIDYQSARLIFRWRSVPKGSRNKPRQFLADLYADWGQNSLAVIQKFRETCPRVYLKVVASILPKQLEIERDSSMELQTINSLLSDCPTCAVQGDCTRSCSRARWVSLSGEDCDCWLWAAPPRCSPPPCIFWADAKATPANSAAVLIKSLFLIRTVPLSSWFPARRTLG
jgi:hypothetical protein